MKIVVALCLCGMLVLSAAQNFAQSKIDPKEIKDKMQWFADAKL